MAEQRAVELLRELVAIDSVNPAYPGGSSEAGVAERVEHECRAIGLDVVRQPVAPGRDTVLAPLSVPGATETLLFEAHMDTVALAPMGEDGLRPVIRDGRLYGRGACDTKGSLASMLAACERLVTRRSEPRVNVSLLAAVDEEHAFTGVLAFVNSDRPATAAVVGEPTDLRVVIAHKGVVRGKIIVVGKAAHSSEPHLGISAIDGMADVLVALRSLRGRLALRAHPLVGSPAFTVGLIEGGTGVNIVPARCVITYDRRILPGERPEAVLAELDALLDEVRVRRPEVTITLAPPDLVDDALETDAADPLVRAASTMCEAVGLDGTPVGVPYGTDASKLRNRRGIPSIVFGPGSIAQAHGADEYVPLDHLDAAVAVYEGTARRLGRNR